MLHTFIEKKILLYISCIALLIIYSFFVCIPVSASSNAENKNTGAKFNRIHKRSVLSFSFRDKVLKSSLTTYFSHNTFLRSFAKKLLLWKRVANDEIVFGFGIEGANIAAGSLQARGFFRAFDDASKIYAWSLFFYEKARWTLKSNVATVPLGIAISYEFSPLSFNAWTTLSDFKSQHRIYATGFATTFKAGSHTIYKARLMYQHFMRQFFHLPKSVLRSWYLTVPSILEVHSLATSHEITASFMDAQFIAKLSIPDTLPIAGGASALLRFIFTPIVISIFAQGASPHYVTSAMKYQRALWSQSTQFMFSYAHISFLRMRYGIYYLNPMTDVSAIRDAIDKTLYQNYFVTWRQEIPNARSTQYLLLHYEFVSQYVRHKAFLYHSLNFASFKFVHGVATTYKHRAKNIQRLHTSDIKYIDMTLDAEFTKKEILPHMNALVRMQTRMRVYEHVARKDASKNHVIRDITFSIGAFMRIGSALFRVTFPYIYKPSENFSTSVRFSMRYTID